MPYNDCVFSRAFQTSVSRVQFLFRFHFLRYYTDVREINEIYNVWKLLVRIHSPLQLLPWWWTGFIIFSLSAAEPWMTTVGRLRILLSNLVRSAPPFLFTQMNIYSWFLWEQPFWECPISLISLTATVFSILGFARAAQKPMYFHWLHYFPAVYCWGRVDGFRKRTRLSPNAFN